MSSKTALSVCSHPDDAEFVCTGTMALLKKTGWDIQIASMTAGDCGSATLSPDEISTVRRKEGADAAAVLEGQYHCLECRDAFIMYDKPTLMKVIELLRRVRPAVVFAPSPQDYFADHEITSQLVRTACFCCGIPNIVTPGVGPYKSVPHLYYADPTGLVDIFGTEILPSIYVDISSVIQTKEKMLFCHRSQRDWLLAHHGMDQYIESMKAYAAQRGAQCGVRYAEGLRQHLGQGYPQDNILKTELAGFIKDRPACSR
jgi:LmbE family N-acetylglucosaminyl deacetylase